MPGRSLPGGGSSRFGWLLEPCVIVLGPEKGPKHRVSLEPNERIFLSLLGRKPYRVRHLAALARQRGDMRARSRLQLLAWVVAVTAAAGANAQFLDTFDDRELSFDPSGVEGWSFFTISRPVLQRLIDGRTLGLAIKPSGSLNASFSAREGELPRLLFDTEK